MLAGGIPERELEAVDLFRDKIAPVESTVDETRVVSAWARARHARSLLVVTSSFHTGRVKLTYRHVFAGSGITFRVRSSTRGLVPARDMVALARGSPKRSHGMAEAGGLSDLVLIVSRR